MMTTENAPDTIFTQEDKSSDEKAKLSCMTQQMTMSNALFVWIYYTLANMLVASNVDTHSMLNAG